MKVKLLVPFFALFFSLLAFSQTINDPNDRVLCDDDNDGSSAFDLSSQTPQILGNLNPVDYSVTYHATLSDVEQQLNPSFFTNTVPFFQIIFVRIDDITTSCFCVGDNTILYLNVSDTIDNNVSTPVCTL